MIETPTIAVIGLGYVGLPLAVALARQYETVGFDISSARIGELRTGHDRTRELSRGELVDSSLVLTDRAEDIAGRDVFIITVPTPVDADNRPDLGAVESACETVAGAMRRGAVVVLESTVYPGVTEEHCGAILERISGMRSGVDFFLGYSPERINPGDRVHTLDRIIKVVAGQTPEVETLLGRIYGSVNEGRVFIARDIRTAEASKVIENAQRDINIAFINEITLIFQSMGLSVYDVLEAARTKWNFLDFTPGLVGGHCIGVDPYYLAHAAQARGYEPEVVLAGRRINDGMGREIANRVHALLGQPSDILVLGVTFKENVPDIRNTKVVDLVTRLREHGHSVAVCDPMADPEETRTEYGLDLIETPDRPHDCIVGAVPHAAFEELSLSPILKQGGLIADLKGLWRRRPIPKGARYWSL